MILRLVIPFVTFALFLTSCGTSSGNNVIPQEEQAALAVARASNIRLQEDLTSLGYYHGPLHGERDEETVAALQAFTTNMGFVPRENVEERSEGLVGAMIGHTDPASVRELQNVLGVMGLHYGEADGVYDDSLEGVMAALQTETGLEADGQYNPEMAVLVFDRFRVFLAAFSPQNLPEEFSGRRTPTADLRPEKEDHSDVISTAQELSQTAITAGKLPTVSAFSVAEKISESGLSSSVVFAGRSQPIPPEEPEPMPVLHRGDAGPEVVALQFRLAELGFRPGETNGEYGTQTASAVMAFQKFVGITRDGVVGAQVRAELTEPSGAGPREVREAPFIEIDLVRQIAFIKPADIDVKIVNISSGNGATYRAPNGGYARAVTPTGIFSIIRRIDGVRHAPLGRLYRPLYFKGGFAVHGSPHVPGYPASHGCVRTANVDQDWIFESVPNGTAVVIY